MTSRSLLGLLLSLAFASPAWAQEDDLDLDDDWDEEDDDDDDDEDDDDDDDDATPAPRPSGEDEVPLDEDPEGDDEWMVQPDAEESQLDFEDDLDEDQGVDVLGPGQDTARIYREQLQNVEDLGPDEEALSWERYLRKYPNSVFRARIENRMEELSVEMFDERVEDRYSYTEDAGRAEINFGQPHTLESIDPRSRIYAGFDLGFPNYFSLDAALEYQLFRELSVHGGVRGRYTGFNIEAGAKYSLVKSARTKMLVTLLGDFHINVNPLQPAFRPQLGVGKRFGPWDNGFFMDWMLQGGTDLVLVKTSADDNQLSVRELGGLHVTLAPSKTVRIFLETSVLMKGYGDDDVPSAFQFDVFSFGLKFVGRKSPTEDQYEIGVGANAPYANKYWAYHFGAVSADVNYFL